MTLTRVWDELGDRKPPAIQIAMHLVEALCPVKADEIEKKLCHMYDRGRRYWYLENCFGAGFCFLMGAEWKETYWTKLLTKSTSRFDVFRKRVQSHTQVSQDLRTRDYGKLRDTLIEEMMRQLQAHPLK